MNLHPMPDLTPRTKEKLIKEQCLQKLHSNPLLPDDIDEHGNLPRLRCGWKKCGKVFQSKEALLRHVEQCLPHPLVERWHTNCKYILESEPDLTIEQFINKVKACYKKKDRDTMADDEFVLYHNKFQPLFKKQQLLKDVSKMPAEKKELSAILFNYRIESQIRLIEQGAIPQEFIE